ncbi:hypothetical protein CBS101457_004231 [Exobasidium rhododendri]|nr:hypothetical protein CBS101457_004231 [Exobasidium rhododendri]
MSASLAARNAATSSASTLASGTRRIGPSTWRASPRQGGCTAGYAVRHIKTMSASPGALAPSGTAKDDPLRAGKVSPSTHKRPTTAQQTMAGGHRSFASSTHSGVVGGAVAEASPPSARQAPMISNNPLLRTNAKSASQTHGIRWTDGEVGLERQVRKMNMFTVRGHRSFSSRAAARVYTPRKTFLYNQYKRLMEESKVVLLLQHNSLSVNEFSKLRREIELVDLTSEQDTSTSSSSSSSKAKLTAVRSGLMRPLVRKSKSLKPLETLFSGPVALLTFDHLSPSYISRVFKVIDRALGAGKIQPKPAGQSGYSTVASNVNTRLTPLAAIVEEKVDSYRLLNVAQLRDVSMLPGLEELRGQIVALLGSAPSQLVSTLTQARGTQLLQTLDARRRDLEPDPSSSSPSSPS